MHRIESQLFVIREKLEAEGLKEEAIQDKLREARKFIEEKLKEDNIIDKKESHMSALAKEQQMEKMKNALRIKGDFKPGSAFDFESQQKRQQDHIVEMEAKRKERKAQQKEDGKLKAQAELEEKKEEQPKALLNKEEGEIEARPKIEKKKTPEKGKERPKSRSRSRSRSHHHHRHHQKEKRKNSSKSRSKSLSRHRKSNS
jgi:serine/arginine repetitive matrix protein 2